MTVHPVDPSAPPNIGHGRN